MIGTLERAGTEVSLAPRFDSSLVHSDIPPLSLFRLDFVLLVSRFLVFGFIENDLERCGMGFFQDLVP